MYKKKIISILGISIFLVTACQSKYERLPKASTQEVEALTQRYHALVAEAKKAQDPNVLLRHFSHAILTKISPADFAAKAKPFISSAAAGELDKVKIKGARAPGKVRVLIVKTSAGKGAIPFVQSSDGWKIDDVDAAFGDFEKELNLDGHMPAAQASMLSFLSIFQDPQSSVNDRVQAALGLADTKDSAVIATLLAKEKKIWAKTALGYAAWKTGAACDSFAKAFPIDADSQKELYDSDSDSFRILLTGLCQCAASSDSPAATIKVYRGCHNIEGGARSEYVDPVVALANKKPAFILTAALKTKFPYEEDPVANIVVGAIHGEKKAGFYRYIYKKARSRGKSGKLAKSWVKKMKTRDEEEPAGTHDQ